MRKVNVFAVAAAVALVALSAASAGRVAAKPTLTVAFFGGCDSQSPGASEWLDEVYEPLIDRKGDGTLVPGLATSWVVSSGNKVMTVTLRRNARFSDGSPVDAQALKTWLDYQTTQPAGDYSLTVRSVKVLGKYRVRITLKSPSPNFALTFSPSYGTDWGLVASPKAVQSAIANPKHPIWNQRSYGAGPYVLLPSETVTGDHCTYVPNKYYYAPSQIRWSKIVIKQITDSNTALAAMKAGQVDVVVWADWRTAPAATAAGIQVLKIKEGYRLMLLDDHGAVTPALKDVRVRQALNYAVDRKTIAHGLYGPDVIPTSVPNPGSDGDNGKYTNYYSYDPAKAKALLAAAGWAKGFTLKAEAPGAWIGGSEDFPGICYAMAQNFAAINVTLQCSVSDTADEFTQWGTNDAKSFWGWVIGWEPLTTYDWYNTFMRPGAGAGDLHGWHDPVVDRLWVKAQRLSPAAAKPLWQQLMARVVTNADQFPLMAQDAYEYVSKRVAGVQASNVGPGYNSIRDWYPSGK